MAFIDHLKKHRLDTNGGGTSTIMDSKGGEGKTHWLKPKECYSSGFIFEHLDRDSRFDNIIGLEDLYTSFIEEDDAEPMEELQEVGDGTVTFQQEGGILIDPKPWEQHKRN